MQSTDVPLTGRYVKHLDTREIIEWICYDPESQLLLIRWPTGSYSLVHRRGITRITPHEEMRYLKLRVVRAN